MPLGIERINARRQQPNSRIIFIKPLPGPTAEFAQDFLERIAAIVHPIMKANHLAITSLEEYEPNREFVGRNFNAGEVVQLVLRAPYGGHWLGFRSVQMVMIHELAHCAQMNHSSAFWKVRNAFAEELRGLWGKGYTGDGFWGRGETLLSGQYDWRGVVGQGEVLPRSLCGGTFRSGRRRKRKRDGEEKKTSLTYAERQRRRIARKFGTDGLKLGNDEETRVKLEDGKRPKGKPRVAGSARGRELRAAAALARFGDQKAEERKYMEKHEADGDGGSESESDDDNGGKAEDERAIDLDGRRLLDGQGYGMVKVCDGEDPDDGHVKREMEELQHIDDIIPHASSSSHGKEEEIGDEENIRAFIKKEERAPPPSQRPPNDTSTISHALFSKLPVPITANPHSSSTSPYSHHLRPLACPLCSQSNDAAALTCTACAHVLDPDRMPGHWCCSGALCAGQGSAYINGGDCGVCGACGQRRQGDGG
ncbi:hypothetical protein MMC07_004129 [Pseudocyphellaria aurata]|nr:hypothetical protein [Pseudocyphellaria aurata]